MEKSEGRLENQSGQSIDVEAVMAYFDSKNIEVWFEENMAEEADDEANDDLFALSAQLLNAVKSHHEIPTDEEQSVSRTISRGLFFGLYACTRHYCFGNEGELSIEIIDQAIAATLEIIDEEESSCEDAESGQWFFELDHYANTQHPGGLDTVINDYKYNLCSDTSMHQFFEFGSKIGGTVFTLAKKFEAEFQVRHEMAIFQAMLEGIDNVSEIDRA